MMLNKEKYGLRDLIEKSEENQLTDDEKHLLDDFIRHEYNMSSWDTSEMGLKGAVSAAIYSKIKLKSLKRSSRKYYKYLAAASIILIMALGILIKNPIQVNQDITITTASKADSVRLNDGSIVYLAANSVFKYPKFFASEIRSVSLTKGDAFFKVAKDPHHPFIITSGGIKTRVLGTSFHIGLHHNECKVTVVTGKVNVSSSEESVNLLPDEEVVFTPAGLRKQKVTDNFLYSWYKKDVELNSVSLKKVFTILNLKIWRFFFSRKRSHPKN
jgi:transmembrane sensor